MHVCKTLNFVFQLFDAFPAEPDFNNAIGTLFSCDVDDDRIVKQVDRTCFVLVSDYDCQISQFFGKHRIVDCTAASVYQHGQLPGINQNWK